MCTVTDTSIYGDITKVDTTGASEETAKQDKLSVTGVAASHKMMSMDFNRVNKYKILINKVACANQIDPAIIGAIISRESRGGNALINGWGDNGNALGLMQVDKNYHTVVGDWDSVEHLQQGTEILTGMIKSIAAKFPTWTKEQQLKGGISAYNAGTINVRTYSSMDIGTTGNDYANDVTARAQWLKNNGY
ncbi:lysozyme g-like 1 [Chiloscyllium plagiosum]|uniref:lysozyme g-like 1 n=1 Tax=Chiloscyllium plagiosum TaxID=36176 RepID=UPI001CB7BA31|nr:lysozyme g-like 1 [Chiloscyllium plagiosum]